MLAIYEVGVQGATDEGARDLGPRGVASLTTIEGMSLFAVHYSYSDDTAARDEHRPAHREFLGALAAEGVVLMSGPYASVEGAPDAALLLLRGSSAAELVELLREDPFQQQGLVDQVAVREWTPVVGAWAQGVLADELKG